MDIKYCAKTLRLPWRFWIFGGWYLFKFGWSFRFNLRHPYLRWRLETVFGNPKFQFSWYYLYSMLCYGYWAHKMKQDSYNCQYYGV